MPGYSSEAYAGALIEIGRPLELPRSGGWLLVRSIPGTSFFDAVGVYPLFCCKDWHGLAEDLRYLASEIVSVSLVADSASEVRHELLQACFPDACFRYKDHYFADLTQPSLDFVSGHHRRNARAALKSLRVERLETPCDQLLQWTAMYDTLVNRHDIQGAAAFSRESFELQLRVPGLQAYAAWLDNEIVGMILWMVEERKAYYHLAAYSETGYLYKASFALFQHCLEAFQRSGIELAAFGGGAGTFVAGDGLARFKQGWANEVRSSYLCGRILDRRRYAKLTALSATEASRFFPAYRTPKIEWAA